MKTLKIFIISLLFIIIGVSFVYSEYLPGTWTSDTGGTSMRGYPYSVNYIDEDHIIIYCNDDPSAMCWVIDSEGLWINEHIVLPSPNGHHAELSRL